MDFHSNSSFDMRTVQLLIWFPLNEPFIFKSICSTGTNFGNACLLGANIPCLKIKLADLEKRLFSHLYACILWGGK